MKNKLLIYTYVFAVGALTNCDFQKMPLPSPQAKSVAFGANDTSYVELNPIWDQTTLGIALNAPSDIIMGPDGIIFLANEGNDQIIALSRAGQVLSEHGLGSVSAVPHPRGLAIDSKLNLLIANGTDKIYCWNQYLNFVTIDSVADVGVYYDAAKRDTVHLSFSQLYFWQQQHASIPRLLYYLFEKNEAKAKMAQSTFVFYQHQSSDAVFNGIAAGKYGSERVYATDYATDKIIQLRLQADLAVKTKDGQVLHRYVGVYARDIATYGSGAGTVDDPWSIVTDRDENIYFTQLGGNFKVQKLMANTYTPKYVLYQHDIMDLNRFITPYDLALDEVGNIFVVDTDRGCVSKFGNSGNKAGQLLSLGKKGLAITTFNDPRGIIVRDQIVYVVERGANRIRRFQYSVSDSDVPDDNQKP